MRAHVIVATTGRSKEVGALADFLARQTLRASTTIVIGAQASDVEGLAAQAAQLDYPIETIVSDRAGLPIQRNIGLAKLKVLIGADSLQDGHAVIFFDDDFRPAREWLESAVSVFVENKEIVGLTGSVLADGVKRQTVSEAEAVQYLNGEKRPHDHWASGGEARDVNSVYGCNMAFRGAVVGKCVFDERLPLYAWQEDRDFTGQALRFGRVIYTPKCRGVHLGVKGARSNGVRLGYSQIANPIYLAKKGTMENRIMLRFVMRAIASNHYGAILRRTHPGDFSGRLKGNYYALFDLLRRQCRPEKILEL